MIYKAKPLVSFSPMEETKTRLKEILFGIKQRIKIYQSNVCAFHIPLEGEEFVIFTTLCLGWRLFLVKFSWSLLSFIISTLTM